jgi:hypothetical protein
MTDLVSTQIAGWVACASFTAFLLVQVFNLVDRLKGKPTAREVQDGAQQTFETQKDCTAKHQTLDARLRELEVQIQRQRDHGDESRRVLHNKIDALKTTMHEMETGIMDRQVAMEERISTKTGTQVGEVHDRVNMVLVTLHEMRGEIKNMHVRANKG